MYPWISLSLDRKAYNFKEKYRNQHVAELWGVDVRNFFEFILHNNRHERGEEKVQQYLIEHKMFPELIKSRTLLKLIQISID